MAKAVIQANIQTSSGTITVAPNASIAIRNSDSGALVSLWTDRAGTIAAINPVTADSNGFFRVYATAQRVNITATYGGSSQVWNDVVVVEDLPASGLFPINLNGNFQVAQAGTSFAAPASGAYDLDGARQYNNTAAVYTVTQGTGSQAWKKARITTITTADASVAAGDSVIDDFPIEGYDIVPLVGNTFTVSFNAKFPVTGIHCVALRNTAADRSYIHEINCTAANTWASYSFTVTGGLPSTGTWVYTNTAGLALSIVRMAGTTYTGTPATADTWMTGNYLTTANQVNDCATIGNVWALEDVRIDLGTVAGTDWPSYQENLARCNRYYYKIYPAVQNIDFGSAYAVSTVLSHMIIPIPNMRIAPTALEQSGAATDYSVVYVGAATVCSVVPAFVSASTLQAKTSFTVAAGLTAGQAGSARTAAGTTAGYLAWSARL